MLTGISNTIDDSINEKRTCISAQQHVMRKVCQVICISKNKKMLLIGSEHDLIIMNFTQCNGQLKQINKLRGHSREINSIKIINSDHEIITAGNDGLINVWKKNEQWKLFKSLKYNSYLFNKGIILNKSENQIIAVVDFGFLKYWTNINDDWQLVNKNGFQGSDFHQIILNDISDTLVGLQHNSIWIIKLQLQSSCLSQKFYVRDSQIQLCFIKNDIFATFSCQNKDIIFYQEDQNQQYSQIKKITIQSNFFFDMKFQPQYSMSEEQLVVKMGNFIFFLQINNNYDLVQQYEIESDIKNCKVLVIEEMSLIIKYYYSGNIIDRVLQSQKYKKFINFIDFRNIG